ncbi:hypothetical protein M3Y97_00415800 [Aphelenchoides bicaudatus]|nr:hypothetical protein M3Y97_00415800 [Aphelenchoides bicaudatus]
MSNAPSLGQIDYNRILRAVRQEFRIVELKELLSEHDVGAYRTTNKNKAQLQNLVEELLRSEKRNQVAHSIQKISKRLNGILSKTVISNDMVRHTTNTYNQRYASHQNMQRQPQFGVPQNYNAAYYDASKVRLVSLPFYDIKQILLAPTTLTPNVRNDGVSMCGKYAFTVPHTEIGNLAYRDQPEITPRCEIQMRMAMCEYDKEQPDSFPNGVKVTINGALVNLPPLLNVQQQPGQPRAEQKRAPRPVNITPYCNPNRDSTHQITVEWQNERHCYLIAVYIVNHVNAAILRDRLANSGARFNEETRTMIKKNLGGQSEDDIAMDSLKISLICPLSRVRMSNPVRSRNCTHLQCFDLFNYLTMNEKRPNWKCPVCNKPCNYDVLVLDSYFAEVISTVGSTVNEVELLPDGSWRVAGEKSVKKSTNNNAAGSSTSSVYKTEPVELQPGTSSASKPSQNAPDIITLDDSSDDEETTTASNDAAGSCSSSRKRTYDQIAVNGDKQDYTIITLDDSDDDGPSQPPVNQPHTISANNSTSSAIPLLQDKNLFESTQDSTINLMDPSTVFELSKALLDFMQKLETDNAANCK